MACLTWLFQRVGSNRVTGAIPKAPDCRDQPSAIHGPGRLQVEHKSSVSSESGEVNDAPRVVSHSVVFNGILPGTVVGTSLAKKSWNESQRRLCCLWLFLVMLF